MFEPVICFRCARMSSRNIRMSWSLATLGGGPSLTGTLCGAWEIIETLDNRSRLTTAKDS